MIDLPGTERLDAVLAEVPNQPAVFLLWPEQGSPYLARTALLRRRLLRLLRAREKPSRLLNLRDAVRRIEYRLTGSSLESSMTMYETARLHFRDTYPELLKLRMPPFVKLTMGSPFPRTAITTHLAQGRSVYFGPFRARASAERFESQMLDLFQLRRCQEDFDPSPAHPGCMYGEMGMCLRPCQQVVGLDEYRHEAARVAEFLSSGGRSLIESIEKARDRFSEEMEFEAAARQHKRLEKVREAARLADEMARDVARLHGAAICRSAAPDSVEMWMLRGGQWLEPRRFSFAVEQGRTISMDQRLRELFAAVTPLPTSARERQERLALLARWFYSSWRDGEWVAFDDYEHIPYRRLVNAISRVVHGGNGPHQEPLAPVRQKKSGDTPNPPGVSPDSFKLP